jgi:hypothetical protein
MQEKPPWPIVYPKIVKVPASPPAPRNPTITLRQPEKHQNVVAVSSQNEPIPMVAFWVDSMAIGSFLKFILSFSSCKV